MPGEMKLALIAAAAELSWGRRYAGRRSSRSPRTGWSVRPVLLGEELSALAGAVVRTSAWW